MYKLTFSELINDDIISSISYIKNTLKAPMAAANHVKEIKKKYEKLKRNPFCRPLVSDKYLASKGLRFIMVKNYMLIYNVNEDKNEVYLYRFMYSRRDWINILTDDLKFEKDASR
jgi:plasmid stabilization system protein ParE